MIKQFSPQKAIYTLRECSSQLCPAGRYRMASFYFQHIVETRKQSDGRTYIEALEASLLSGRADLQPILLYRLVRLWRSIHKECMARRERKTRSLEGVLYCLKSNGLILDTEIVNVVRDRLHRKQSPKDLLQ